MPLWMLLPSGTGCLLHVWQGQERGSGAAASPLQSCRDFRAATHCPQTLCFPSKVVKSKQVWESLWQCPCCLTFSAAP